jgi:hypothetical protein
VQLAVRFRDRRLRVAAEFCAAHLVRAENRGTARADRDLVDLLDEGVEILAAIPRCEGLPGEEDLLCPSGRISRRKTARVVAIASGSNAYRATAFDDPGVSTAALMGGSVDAARVWVAEVLGPLACRKENDERLRETLRVFLRSGSSFKAAAEELHLHFNSVKYRVQRAIERRGRPIGGNRLDIEVALLLCHWYGVAVLTTSA